jgi:predicted N-acetyltransferase YhbS
LSGAPLKFPFEILQVIRQLAEWFYSEWLSTNPQASIDKMEATLSLRAESNSVPLTMVCFDEDKALVGSASLTVCDMKSHPELTPWVGSVYVASSARGRGIAFQLCFRIEAEANRLGYSKIYLFTKDKMPLYLKLGWSIKCTEEYNGMQVTIMEKDL